MFLPEYKNEDSIKIFLNIERKKLEKENDNIIKKEVNLKLDIDKEINNESSGQAIHNEKSNEHKEHIIINSPQRYESINIKNGNLPHKSILKKSINKTHRIPSPTNHIKQFNENDPEDINCFKELGKTPDINANIKNIVEPYQKMIKELEEIIRQKDSEISFLKDKIAILNSSKKKRNPVPDLKINMNFDNINPMMNSGNSANDINLVFIGENNEVTGIKFDNRINNRINPRPNIKKTNIYNSKGEICNFKEEDYPIFDPKYYEVTKRNIRKDFSEAVYENNKRVIYTHKVYLTSDFNTKKTDIIEIEKVKSDCIIKDLKKNTISTVDKYDNSFKSYFDKYNSEFNIDNNFLLMALPGCDLFIKSEKYDPIRIVTFALLYNKLSKTVHYRLTDATNVIISLEQDNVSPKEVVKIYNQYKSSFEFDISPEPFNYNEVPNILRINIGNNIVVNNGRRIQNNGQRYNNYNNNNSPRQSYNNNSPRQSDSNNNNNGNNSVRSRRSSHSIRDANGMNIGGVDRDGGIRNSNGIRIGNFDADGAIRDENGIRVGEIDNDGNIRNSNGIRIGDVDNNGDVRDANGIRIGEIDSEGNVRDANGVRIGSAEGMDKEQAAYMFFFK